MYKTVEELRSGMSGPRTRQSLRLSKVPGTLIKKDKNSRIDNDSDKRKAEGIPWKTVSSQIL